MKKVCSDKVELVTFSDLALLRVTTSFVESSALAFGLGPDETIQLTLAVEEIFAHLCKTVPHKDPIWLNVAGRGYEVETEFIFSCHEFDLRVFNLACVQGHGEDLECTDETGMMIASRMVDSFSLEHSKSKLKLKLIKEKFYPEIEQYKETCPDYSGEINVREADIDEIKDLIGLASVNYPKINLPECFRYPGKVIDMAAYGYYHVVVAVDHSGMVAGGITWRWESEHLVTFRGPFVTPALKSSQIPDRLIEHLIEQTARTKAIGVICSWPTSDLPGSLFEELGSQYFMNQGQKTEVKAYFRQLNEDPGNTLVVHSCIVEFVKKKTQELFLGRQIETLIYTGESRFRHSVISAKILRSSDRAILRPVIYGDDATDNLMAHVRLLNNDGIENIFFEMDLGFSQYGMFAPSLIECSFKPRFLIPLAGKSDIVVFQYLPGETN